MATPKRSTNVDKNKRKLSAYKPPEVPVGYRCVSCGRTYEKQNGNFYKSKSKIFAGNDQYAPFCKDCLESLYMHLTEFYGNDEYRAMERICMMLDLYYSDSIMDQTSKATTNTRIAAYLRLLNLTQPKDFDKTYNDTVIELKAAKVSVDDAEDVRIANETQETRITQRDLDLFGFGWAPDEYADMRRLYRNMRDGKGDLTAKEEMDLVSLCRTRSMINRALAAGNNKDYISLTGLYQDTVKQFEERFKKESAAQQSSIDPVGVMIRTIEQYTPAEYYKDKQLYKDADGVKEYIERFMTRPLRNIILGTKDMDEEFSVEDGSSQ